MQVPAYVIYIFTTSTLPIPPQSHFTCFIITLINILAAFICVGGLSAPSRLPLASRDGGLPDPQNVHSWTYFYNFAVYAAFDDMAASSDYSK